MKEKPIGLAVGLMFIIGFGLILSLVMKPRPRTAQSATAADENTDRYTVSPVIYDDSRRFTPVPEEATPAGPGDDEREAGVIVMGPETDSRDGVVVSEIRGGGDEVTTLAATGAPGSDRHGVIVTPVHGESRVESPVEAVGPRTVYVSPAGTATEHVVDPTGAVRAQAVYYTVQPGDSLIRIAKQNYGPENWRKYKLIYEANRESMRSESDVLVGQELLIPPLAEPAAPAERASTPRAASPRPVAGTPRGDRRGRHYVTASIDELPRALTELTSRRAVVESPSPARAGRTYKIRRGDNLTRIARRTMGDDSPAAVRRLYEANRGVLASPDLLPIGETLRIPR